MADQIPRFDGWENTLTGLGSMKDKSTGLQFTERRPLRRQEIDALYRQSALVARVVDKIVDDAFRKGWTVEADWIDDPAALKKSLESFQISRHVRRAAKWSRLYGGAAVALPTMHHREVDLATALDVSNVAAIMHPVALGAWEIWPLTYDDSFGSPTYRKPLVYQLATGQTTIEIHRSRLLIFEAVDLPLESLEQSSNSNLTGWGPSVIERIYDELSRYGATQRHAAAMLYIASILYLKMADYRRTAQTQEGRAQLRTILANMRDGMDSLGVLGLDTLDDLGVLQLGVQSLPEIIDRFTDALAAVSGMPREVLLNESPAGLNAGQLSGPQELWFGTVQGYRDEALEPAIRQFCDFAFQFWGYPDEPYEIVWGDLWMPSEKEQAETASLWAAVDKTYVEIGAASGEEIREHRLIKDQPGAPHVEADDPANSPALDLSVESDAEEANTTPVPADAKTPLEIAEVLGVSRQSVINMHRRGEIQGWRVGNQWRFSQAEVLKKAHRPV